MEQHDIENKLFKALRTLSILSYIMCGIWLIMSLFTYLTSNLVDENMLKEMSKMNEQQSQMVAIFLPYMKPWAISVFLLTLVSLAGVIMMSRLNFNGLYLYVVGELGFVFVGIVLNKAMQNPAEQGMQGLYQLLISIGLDSIFIFQYRNILKYLLKR